MDVTLLRITSKYIVSLRYDTPLHETTKIKIEKKLKKYFCLNLNLKGKHRNVCRTSTKSKRKVFDSGRQRADGSDVIYSKTKETKKIQILGEVPEVNSKNNVMYKTFN